MNAEIFSATISALLFGFAAGMSMEVLISADTIGKLNRALQKSIDSMFDKDQTIDELAEELENLKSRYKQLYEATETSRKALNSVKHLPPPPFPLERSEHYVDEDLSPISVPTQPHTPTCAPSNKD
jgi:hypothetical protein